MDYRFELLWRDKKKKETLLIRPATGHVRVCAAFPNSYELAMSSLGFHYLYSKLGSYPELAVERAYLPDKRSMPLVTSKYLPSFETLTPLSNFNILAFTLSYESDFFNVLKMLKLARIPLRASDRRGGGYPLVICGGPAALQNVIPVAEAFDLIALGCGEASIPAIVQGYIGLSRPGETRGAGEVHERLVKKLSSMPNFITGAEAFAGGTPRRFAPAVAAEPEYARSVILTPETEFPSRALFEVQRGCVRRCRFCMVGNCYGGFRSAAAEEILDYAAFVGGYTKKLGLMGPAVSAHPQIESLYRHFNANGFDASMSSVYIEEMSADALRMAADNLSRTITCGVESASERVRGMAGKRLTDEALLSGMTRAAAAGFTTFKMYFILGLYDAYGADGAAEAGDTAELVLRAGRAVQSVSPGARIRLSVNPLILKPRTPLYDAPASPGFEEFYGSEGYLKALEERFRGLVASLKPEGWVEFSEKSFADAALLKKICECGAGFIDFFDDLIYNETPSARRLMKIFEPRREAFGRGLVAGKLFRIDRTDVI